MDSWAADVHLLFNYPRLGSDSLHFIDPTECLSAAEPIYELVVRNPNGAIIVKLAGPVGARYITTRPIR
jgi:hypothetical protein